MFFVGGGTPCLSPWQSKASNLACVQIFTILMLATIPDFEPSTPGPTDFGDNLLWVLPCIFQKQQVLRDVLYRSDSVYTWGDPGSAERGPNSLLRHTQPSQSTDLQTSELLLQNCKLECSLGQDISPYSVSTTRLFASACDICGMFFKLKFSSKHVF